MIRGLDAKFEIEHPKSEINNVLNVTLLPLNNIELLIK